MYAGITNATMHLVTTVYILKGGSISNSICFNRQKHFTAPRQIAQIPPLTKGTYETLTMNFPLGFVFLCFKRKIFDNVQ